MATYFVEAHRTDQGRGVSFRTHRAAVYSADVLTPDTTAVFCVEGCRTANQAVALVIEKAAGRPVTVTQVFPRTA